MDNIVVIGLLGITSLYAFFHGDNIPEIISAIAVVNFNSIKGTVKFTENKNIIDININLTGLPPSSSLGFHIHEAGDLSEGCKSACEHFNPDGKTHGGPNSSNRHVGDLGNIQTDTNGNCIMTLTDHLIKLRGYKYNIIGRSIVIHEKTDDLGLGDNEESLKTGNAGARIACAVIGYMKGC
jgi:Cu-Zn family superoxide dismutase